MFSNGITKLYQGGKMKRTVHCQADVLESGDCEDVAAQRAPPQKN